MITPPPGATTVPGPTSGPGGGPTLPPWATPSPIPTLPPWVTPVPDPTAPPGCTTSGWTNGACGAPQCNIGQRYQTRTTNPLGCASSAQCVLDATCPMPTTPPGCFVGSWTNRSCGAPNCPTGQRYQTTVVSPSGCTPNFRCIVDATCSSNIPTPVCDITLTPTNSNITIGTSATFTVNIINCNVSIDYVKFTNSNNSVATISTLIDSTGPIYSTTITGVTSGTSIVTATVYAGRDLGSASSVVTSANANAWWQVKDSDIATNGNLVSLVPTSRFFGIAGTGGFPGIPGYGGATNLSNTTVSSTGWLTQNTITNPKVFDYQSFVDRIPSDVVFNVINTSSVNNSSFNASNSYYGYVWYKYSGGVPLSIDGQINVGSKKIILLVDSNDLIINNNIKLTLGNGFFMAIVGKTAGGTKGNIIVNPTVGGVPPQASANIEGIYEADGNFSDGVGNNQLWVRGSVVAYGNITLQRDLGVTNASTPAELFEFAPDLMLLYPNKLGVRRINWKEVAP
jgi:hypothetical protein